MRSIINQRPGPSFSGSDINVSELERLFDYHANALRASLPSIETLLSEGLGNYYVGETL